MRAPVQSAKSKGRLSAFAWTIPAVLAVLLAACAVGSLASGSVPPDLIGADGLAATVVGSR
jgi:hypothetical protein